VCAKNTKQKHIHPLSHIPARAKNGQGHKEKKQSTKKAGVSKSGVAKPAAIRAKKKVPAVVLEEGGNEENEEGEENEEDEEGEEDEDEDEEEAEEEERTTQTRRRARRSRRGMVPRRRGGG